MSTSPDPRTRCLGAAIAAKLYNQPGTDLTSPSYPPISSIPRTSPSRLAESAATNPTSPTSTTILYLAYGSNLCAATFLGKRGIRPLSQVNVSAPSLQLVFDLPGTPYTEPCFANTRPRSIPKPPAPTPPGVPLPDLPDPPVFPPHSAVADGNIHAEDKQRPWDKGLIGVVYEVTPEDYATIIATEGGGSDFAYRDILVPCLALPPRLSVPEKPPIPEIPRPFLAHTLYMPTLSGLPDKPSDDSSDLYGDDDKPPVDDPRKKWYWRFIGSRARKDGYAQPSARYLGLITTGAAEHDLPEDYQLYLASLQPYTITSTRQRIGALLVTLVLGSLMPVIWLLGRRLADEHGRFPRWLGLCMAALFSTIWKVYDAVLKPVFGDGERTQEKDEKEALGWGASTRRRWRGKGTDEEKACLLR